MTIGFEFCYSEKMYLNGINTTEGIEINVPAQPFTLDEAIDKAKYLIDTYHAEEVCACNAETGEVIFIARAHEDDEVVEIEDDQYYYDDWMDEIGFNPYMGGYDYDC